MLCERRKAVLKDGRVHNGSLDPRGVLSRRVLLDQCQTSGVAVEQVGGNEGNASAGEDIELDHNSRLWRGGGGVEVRG